ncbi:MAG: hypothetical protein ACXWK1_21475 [Caulobacteraceae bacterium]
MSTGDSGLADRPHRPATSKDPSATLRRWWGLAAAALLAAILVQAVFAGAMLSGFAWARAAHAAGAVLLIAATGAAGVAAALTLRRIPQGPKLAWTLLGLAAGVWLQAALGAFSAKGANLLWAHVPLGVALVGLAAQAAVQASRLARNHP